MIRKKNRSNNPFKIFKSYLDLPDMNNFCLDLGIYSGTYISLDWKIKVKNKSFHMGILATPPKKQGPTKAKAGEPPTIVP